MTQILIGLFAPQQSGKNTVVNMLRSYEYYPLSISQPMKDLAHKLMGDSYLEFEKDTPQQYMNGYTPREIYIDIGKLEKYNYNMFVDIILNEINTIKSDRFVIESVGRQYQWYRILEWSIYKDVQPFLVEIERPNHVWRDSRTPIQDRIPSFKVRNDGELSDLKIKVQSLIDKIAIQVRNYPRNRVEDVKWLISQGHRITHEEILKLLTQDPKTT